MTRFIFCYRAASTENFEVAPARPKVTTIENGEVIVEVMRSRHHLLNFPILHLTTYHSHLTPTSYCLEIY